MKKNLTKLLSLALVVLLMVALALPAMATDPGTSDTSGIIYFDKNYKVSSSATNVPAETFTFTLTATTMANPGTSFTAIKGVLDGITTTTNVAAYSYTSGDTASIEVAYAGTETATNGVATKTFKLDFTALVGVTGKFDAPGVYSYTLTENAGTTDGMTYSKAEYTIDVYVGYAQTSEAPATWADTLSILNIVVTKTKHTDGTTDGLPAKVNARPSNGDSEGDFDNILADYSLTVDKKVTGNQGSHTKKFTFTISEVSDVPDGTYTIEYSSGADSGNPSTVTIENGNIKDAQNGGLVITLAHNESFTIKGLPAGAKCKITESDYDGYTASYQINNYGTPTTGNVCDLTQDTYTNGLQADTTVHYTNYRNGTVPTGILLTIAPFAVLMVVGAAGVLFFVLKKKRN